MYLAEQMGNDWRDMPWRVVHPENDFLESELCQTHEVSGVREQHGSEVLSEQRRIV
jgi:hypothetical protein